MHAGTTSLQPVRGEGAIGETQDGWDIDRVYGPVVTRGHGARLGPAIRRVFGELERRLRTFVRNPAKEHASIGDGELRFPALGGDRRPDCGYGQRPESRSLSRHTS